MTPSALAAPTGGAGVPEDPHVAAVRCLPTAEVQCPADGTLVAGGRLIVQGEELQATSRILFLGQRGRADDVSVRPRLVDDNRVEAVVSRRAKSGRVTVVNSLGARTGAPNRVRIAAPDPPDLSPRLKLSGPQFFFDGRRKPTFAFQVDRAMQATVEVVRNPDGAVVQTLTVAGAPGQQSHVSWNGSTVDGSQPNGSFRFRLAGDAAASGAPVPESQEAFGFFDHLFPIRGRHDLGQSATNDFGGGRGHKGQDMFARCGTRLAAARGGTVKFAGFHAAAGNYLVIDGRDNDMDYVYMHMRDPALVKAGQRVYTGQMVGRVGETGRATGCHLHFELWQGGWYDGGQPFDPLPLLKAWDAFS